MPPALLVIESCLDEVEDIDLLENPFAKTEK